MKKTVCALLVISLLLSLCSCGSSARKTELTVGFSNEVQTLDPINATGDAEKMILSNCFEGLMTFDESGKPELSGATGYSLSGDMLTYIFTLNPNAEWYISDEVRDTIETERIENFNKNITAEDFVYGINRLIESGCDELGVISKITAEDKHTLKITLKEPDVDFLYKLASLPAYPCNESFVTALGGIYATTTATVITNGAYIIDELNPSGNITLIPNPDYKGKVRVLNRKIQLRFTDKLESVYTRFEKGDYDIYASSSLERPSTDIKATSSVTTAIWGLCFNCSKDQIKNDNLRKAILTATPTQTVKTPSFASGKAKRVIPDNYLVGTQSYDAFKKEDIFIEYTPDFSAQLLDKALTELNADSVTIKIYVPDQLKTSFLRIENEWKNIFGDKLIVDLRTFSPLSADSIKDKNEYDLAVLPLSPKTTTAYGVLESISESPCYFKDKNFEQYKNAVYNETEKTASSFKYAENYLALKCVFIPLFYSGNDLYQNSGVSGVYFADIGEKTYFYKGEKTEK